MGRPLLSQLTAFASVFIVGACVSPYTVEPAAAHFSPTAAVQIVDVEPGAPCVLVATFRGNESAACPAGERYCLLQKLARSRGANTILMERTEQSYYEGEWKEIRGRLVHLRPFTTTTHTGKFLRCEDNASSDSQRRR